MKNVRMVSFLALALILCLGTAMAADLKPLDVKIEILCGKVQLTRNDAVQNCTPAVALLEGDVLETQSDSKAELVYNDGTRMRMKPETKVEIHAVSLKILRGQTWHQFTKRGTEFVIETPSLVAGIRGTQFDVTVNSRGKSILAVMEGKVSVKNRKGGNEVMVKQGFVTTGFVGGQPTTPIKFRTDKKAAEWQDCDWMTGANVDPFLKGIYDDSKKNQKAHPTKN